MKRNSIKEKDLTWDKALKKSKEVELPKCSKCGKIPFHCNCPDFEDIKK